MLSKAMHSIDSTAVKWLPLKNEQLFNVQLKESHLPICSILLMYHKKYVGGNFCKKKSISFLSLIKMSCLYCRYVQIQGLHSSKDPAYSLNMGMSFGSREDLTKVAVNWDSLAVSFIPTITSACVLLPSIHDALNRSNED